MVMCLGQGADLHMAQLMPLPLTISCSSKSRLVLPFWCRLTQAHTHTQPFYSSLDFVRETRVSQYQKKHSPIHTYHGHQSSLICFIHLIRSIASSLFNLSTWQSFPQSLSKFSLVYLFAWHPPLHTAYISSPNHCLLFATHAHTITTCFAVVPILCHLIPVSLSTLYLEFYLIASCHTSI